MCDESMKNNVPAEEAAPGMPTPPTENAPAGGDEFKKKLQKSKAASISGKVAVYAFLVLYAILILLPFLIVFLTSIKSAAAVQKNSFKIIPDDGFTFAAYGEVFRYNQIRSNHFPQMIRGFLNTLMYVIPPTVIGLFTSSLSAYAFSKLRFRAKKWMYSLMLGTMMIPGTIMIVSQYSLYDAIYWTETPLPLMIPGMFGAAACVFFMRQFFTGIPDSIIEAAKLDGLGFLGIFFRIMVPLSVPALLAQGILGFVGGYNDYLGPLMYIHDADLKTLQIVLRTLVGERGGDEPNVTMAAAVVAMIPTLLIYFFAQKYFIDGIVTSGLKQ